jgi:hypothetical protein
MTSPNVHAPMGQEMIITAAHLQAVRPVVRHAANLARTAWLSLDSELTGDCDDAIDGLFTQYESLEALSRIPVPGYGIGAVPGLRSIAHAYHKRKLRGVESVQFDRLEDCLLLAIQHYSTMEEYAPLFMKGYTALEHITTLLDTRVAPPMRTPRVPPDGSSTESADTVSSLAPGRFLRLDNDPLMHNLMIPYIAFPGVMGLGIRMREFLPAYEHSLRTLYEA